MDVRRFRSAFDQECHEEAPCAPFPSGQILNEDDEWVSRFKDLEEFAGQDGFAKNFPYDS